ncbi:MAG: hypothetical protein AB7W59_08975 [Acidimicrobiia bacterium]
MVALKMCVVLAASLVSALLTGALLRLTGLDVPRAGTLVGAGAGVAGVLVANLVRLRAAGTLVPIPVHRRISRRP